MNGFSLQSTTTPRKAWKGIESALVFIGEVPEGQSRLKRCAWWLEKICMVESDRGMWVVKSAFGVVKHGGVTPINLGKSQPLP
ncbi:unnamed protein product [Prunus brigantina]